jgi:hypothetical protein
MRCWMPFLVALVAFLVIPVFIIIGAEITAFSTAAASVTATSSARLCKLGAFRVCHFCDHIFAILIQKMQRLLVIIGIAIVTCFEIVLQIHLAGYRDAFHFDEERHMRCIALQHHLAQVVVPRVLDP